MGLIVSYQKEALSRTYRTLTKDDLTLMIHDILKNTIAKWCYPSRNPKEVSQKEVNQFLDIADFNSKSIRVNYPSIEKSYEIPYDIYLRGIYRQAEELEKSLGTNMDKVLFEKVIGKLYGVNASCINTLYINKNEDKDKDTFIYNKNIKTNLKDSTTESFAKAILSTYSKCRYGAIIVSSYKFGNTAGHRTLIYIENINNNLNIFYYDPHGSSKASWSNKKNIYNTLYYMFDSIIRPYSSSFGIEKIIINSYDTICLVGIQSHSYKYDIGMCQIFSSLWLYNVVKIIAESTKNNIQLPSTDKWLYLVDDYFISQFNDAQRYNAILLFISRLFNFYVQNNKNYLNELENYNTYLLSTKQIYSSFEVPYTKKSKEDIEETEKYIYKVALEGINQSRKDEQKQKKRKSYDESKDDEYGDTYEQYEKRIKKQQKKEVEYSKTFKSLIPFISKKKLFDECKENNDCLTGCCYFNDLDNKKYCNDSIACSK